MLLIYFFLLEPTFVLKTQRPGLSPGRCKELACVNFFGSLAVVAGTQP